MTDRERLAALMKLAEAMGVSFTYKDKVWWMRLLGWFLLVFGVDGFTSKYTTVFWKTISFPSEQAVENSPRTYFCVVFHELWHKLHYDSLWSYIIWSLKYMYPQSLALLAPIGILGLIWWTPLVAFFGFFLVATPLLGKLEARWRLDQEIHGYGASSCAELWIQGRPYDGEHVTTAARSLSTGYFMKVPADVNKLIADAASSIELRAACDPDGFFGKVRRIYVDDNPESKR